MRLCGLQQRDTIRLLQSVPAWLAEDHLGNVGLTFHAVWHQNRVAARQMRETMSRLHPCLALASFVLLAGTPTAIQAQIALFGPTMATVEYRQNSVQLLPSASFSAINSGWQAPSTLFTLPVTDPLAAGAFNQYQGIISHDLINQGFGVYSIEAPPGLGTLLAQTDPASAFPQTSMQINFSIDLLWGASLGTTFTSTPINYLVLYSIPPGGTGSIVHTINYTSSISTFLLPILPTQIAVFPGAIGTGVFNMTALGGGFYPGSPGETFRVSGSIVFLADNEAGPVELRVVPSPGAGLGIIVLCQLMAIRRRRA